MRNLSVITRPSNLGWHFKVQVQTEKEFMEYSVTMDKDFYSRLSTTAEPEKVIECCLNYLLDKEPANQIMSEFDVGTIERYFPEFMGEIGKRLASLNETY